MENKGLASYPGAVEAKCSTHTNHKGGGGWKRKIIYMFFIVINQIL